MKTTTTPETEQAAVKESDVADEQRALAEENDRVEAEQAEAASPDEGWEKAVIVARGRIPADASGPVIVVQTSERQEVKASHRHTGLGAIKDSTYPKSAALYFAIGDEAQFGDRSPVARAGVRGRGNVAVFGYNKFSLRPGTVNVGPASPVYAAANYAYNKGARSIEIVGLKPDEITALRPWFDEVSAQLPDLNLNYGG